MNKHILAAFLATTALCSHAETSDWRFFAGAYYGFGGDTLASGTYTDGSPWNVNAGKGLQASLGAEYRLSERLAVQASVGYQYDIASASNGDITFKRVPIEILGFYDVAPQWRLGAGLRKSTQAELTATGAAANAATASTYDSTVGGVMELQYIFNAKDTSVARKAQVGVSVRYVTESFKANGGNGSSQSGNHADLGLVFYY